MAWIESHQSVWEHAKTRKAARRLGVSTVQLVGHLHALWHWAVDHAEDGNVSKYDADDLAIAARWEGDPHEFVTVLTECGPGDSAGYLERGGAYGPPDEEATGELVLHDWWQYAGKLIARRFRDRDRAAARRSTDRPATVARPSPDGPQDAASRATNQPTDQHDTTDPRTSSPSGDDGFEHFWAAWPKRNGKKLAKDKAHRAWSRLTLPERRDAYRGAVNYAKASEAGMAGGKDAFRWLQGREWPDWQTPAESRQPGDGVLINGSVIPL